MKLYKVITQESNEYPQTEEYMAARELHEIAMARPEAIKIVLVYHHITVIS